MIKNKKILALEMVGTIFIIMLGTAIHFTFNLSGNNPIVGAFSAVNESVWEHLKLPFTPTLLWLLIALYPIRKNVSNYFLARAVGLVLMIFIIPVVFYAYTAFSEEILAVDIATFIVAVIIGQAVSFTLFKHAKASKLTEAIGLIVIASLAVAFIVFTFYPPHLQIFLDPETCQYGI
jgi:hypothetical protein